MLITAGFVLGGIINGPGKLLGSQVNISSTSLLAVTNRQRTDDNEAALSLNPKLMSAAQTKANDMVNRNYWSHDTPDGKLPWSFMIAAGYSYQMAGENLAYGFADANSVISGWMNSPEHRANILNSGYQDVGFGTSSSPDFNHSGPQTIVVAMYGRSSTAPDNQVNISFKINNSTTKTNPTAGSLETSKSIALVQLLTMGQAPWSVLVLSVIGTATLIIFFMRHGRAWKQTWRHGEAYVVSHPWFDIALVFVLMICYVFSRSAGFIH